MRVSRHLTSAAGAVLRPVGTVGPALAVLLAVAVAGAAIGALGVGPARAQPASGAPPPAAPAPQDLRTLADLLDKPDVRAWVRSHPDVTAAAPPPQQQPQSPAESATRMIGSPIDAARASVRRLAGAIPQLPTQLEIIRAALSRELDEHGVLGLLGPLAGFAVLGSLAEALFWRATKAVRERIIVRPVDTVEQRLHAGAWRLSYGIALIGVFAAGGIGAFLAFDWPPLLQEIVLTYLLVVLAVRLTLIGGRIVLAPGAERFRLLPMSTVTARYWFVWSAVLVGAFYFCKGTFRLVPVLGATLDTRTLVGTVLSMVMLALALVALWRRPAFDGSRPPHRVHEGMTWLITLYLGGVWLTVFTGETAPFDIGVVALLVVLAIVGLDLIVAHLLRGPPEEATHPKPRPIAVVTVHRGLRIALLAGGALAVAYILGLDLTSLAANDTLALRLIRAGLDIVMIVLVADFVWEMARIGIDHHLSGAASAETAGTDAEIRHRQRLRTLLPVLRNVLLSAVVAIASLMAISTLGVDIRPLVAGAGVVGIALGFGAQALVKDVIAGMFFLFDDAFRVGEYIESGHIKGTVEAFSLRSVKIRHHRGALHTVPFGALSTITNYSRDWVIDKMSIGVTYETDLDAVKGIVKQIGRTLEDDPEFAPLILETLKMQGVEKFGDFAVQVRLKMTTRPGEQFAIRRRAYALIKRAFDEHGIKFAYPTVTLAGDGSAGNAAAGAAAKTALDVVQAGVPRGAA